MAFFSSTDVPDEKLLKRAKYGGRNVTGLAILATLLALAFGAFAGIPETVRDVSFAPWMAGAVALIAVSYWFFAVAARRGGATSLTVLLGFLALQFVLSTLLNVYILVRSGDFAFANLLWSIIPLLVIAALARDRSDLIELQKRGLWSQAFGAEDRTRGATVAGTVLLIAGFVTLYGSITYFAAVGNRTNQFRKDFVGLVENEQRQFIAALSRPNALQDKQSLESVIEAADKLLANARALSERAADVPDLQPILADYIQGAEKWKSGLDLLRQTGVVDVEVQASLQAGDALNQKALKEFDRRILGIR